MKDEKLALGESLVKQGLLTGSQLQMALNEQKKTGGLLGEILIRMHFINEEALARSLSSLSGIRYVDVMAEKVEPEAMKLVPDSIARMFCILPLGIKEGRLVVAIGNPQDTFAIDELRKRTGKDIILCAGTPSQINRALDKYYGAKAELKGIITEAKKEAAAEEAVEDFTGRTQLEDAIGEATSIKLVEQLLIDAIKDRASDIHIEPEVDIVNVRFRIDGVLKDIISPSRQMHEAVVSRIKVLSNLDIAEKRIPQDGKFSKTIENMDVDVRVSTFPTLHGEKVVMRILNRSMLFVSLEDLGLESQDLMKFQKLIRKPHGIIFVTGPTGCGKTSTLYAVLETIKSREKNIMTIEDPVEYELRGISQSQVNIRANLTFSTLLRAIMRQDPNIILVGETRDTETAEVAVRSALTGHLVFSTLHTNDAAGAVNRLIDMGIEPFLVATSIIGIVAQRLVRSVCPKCKEEYTVKEELARDLGLEPGVKAYRGIGCDNCFGSGYKGRIGIFEVLEFDNEIRELVLKRIPSGELKKVACQKGIHTLRQDALQKALKGITTLEEVVRVTEKD